MSGRVYEERDEAPVIEVRVWRHGTLIRRELCETEEEAAFIVEAAAELDGVECEVDDLTVRHRPGDIAEPTPAEVLDDEGYTEARQRASEELEARRYE